MESFLVVVFVCIVSIIASLVAAYYVLRNNKDLAEWISKKILS